MYAPIASQDTLFSAGETCCINVREGLLQASAHGELLALKGLLQCPDGDVNSADSKGRTLLYMASWKRQLHIVRELLSRPKIGPNKACGV